MKVFHIAVTGVLAFMTGFFAGSVRTAKKIMKQYDEQRETADKHQRYEMVYSTWLMAKKYGVPLDAYLMKQGIHKVVIYGTTEYGFRLYHELKDTQVEVLYALDRNPKYKIPGLKTYRWGDKNEQPPEEQKQSADAVIVSLFLMMDEIEPALSEAGYTCIISLEQLIYNLLEKEEE